MSSAGKPIHPEVMYAERSSDSDPEKNFIYLTFRIDDLNPGYKVDLKADSLTFSGTSGDESKGLPKKEWGCTLNFYHEIDPENSKQSPYTGRDLLLVLRKKELKAEYWPRLTKEPVNRNWIKTDFARWADEDEQEELDAEVDGDDMAGMGGMGGMPGMGGMGGMPGMGGMGGGPGGMDMASLMGGMGGGGAGGAPGGMDFAKLMEQMGGAGGAGGPGGPGGAPGGMDFAKLMEQMGGAGGAPGAEGEDGEEAEAADAKAEVDAEGKAEFKAAEAADASK